MRRRRARENRVRRRSPIRAGQTWKSCVWVWLLVGGCQPVATTQAFPVTVLATEDGERPLGGVAVESIDGTGTQVIAESDATGIVRVVLRGEAGSAVPLSAYCPDGYRLVEPPRRVILRELTTLADTESVPLQVNVRCAPLLRPAVIVVRAGGKAGLPVLLDGEEAARTNDAGVAHIALRAPPGERLVVSLDTSSHPELRPQNPSAAVRIPDRPEILLYDQTFEEPPPRRTRRRRRRPVAPMIHVPMRLGSGGGFHR
ncbi:MAG: hypothetical protein AAGF12_07670 [Myxococcota bacterium]